VSKTAKAGAPDSESSIPFEEALQKLESIVESMESGELTLEQLLGRFEEGARLSRACQQRLEAAEIRVQQLEKSLTGDLTVRPVETSVEDTGT
jgi:exodeoxyribonuclease VII small subunit